MGIFGFLSDSDKRRFHPVHKSIVREFNKIRNEDKSHRLCHAPFKSMTFMHTGAMQVCWYNKLFPLGHYPENNLQEIWFSERSKKLRDFIKHNDLSYGCVDCRKNINEKNFFNVGAWRYDFLPESDNDYPASIDFQISNACNLQCIMCNGEYSATVRTQRENKQPYKSQYDDDFFRQILPFIPHLREASFSGGEPFFAKEFSRVWDLMIEHNPAIRCSVSTNGTIFNQKTEYYLESLAFNIAFSLDAIDQETYCRIRINANYDNVMAHLEKFYQYTLRKNTDFTVKMCALQQNWHDIPNLTRFVDERDMLFLFNTVFYPPYSAIWSMRSEKIEEVINHLKKFTLKGGSYVQNQNATCYQDLIRQIEGWKRDADIREQEGFYQKGIEELKDIFLTKVQNYIEEELKYLGKDCPVNMRLIEELVDNLIREAPNSDVALKGMQFYASARVERWLSEIVARTYEKNLDRFLQIGLHRPPEKSGMASCTPNI